MRICRFDGDRLGLVANDEIIDVSEALAALDGVRWPAPVGDALIAGWDKVAPRITECAARGARKKVTAARLQSPIANPSKIVGIARNRKDLGSETNKAAAGAQTRQDGDPVHMFIKANSALVGPSDGIALRFLERRNDPEAELTIVIGKGGTDIPREQALEHVFGYTIGLDVTLRGKESPSSRKSIDSYAVVGPWVVTRDELPDPDAVTNWLKVNDRLIHEANTKDFAFDVRTVIAHVSTFYTLHPGDLIMAGTPVMSEPVVPGDTIFAKFDGIGEMQVTVRAHPAG